MLTIIRSLACIGLILNVALFVAFPAGTLALTQILPEAIVEADQQSLMELIGTFDRAEEAIRARDLDALMALYATTYQYHGLRRGDIRKIWADLFVRYDLIANMHTVLIILSLPHLQILHHPIWCNSLKIYFNYKNYN